MKLELDNCSVLCVFPTDCELKHYEKLSDRKDSLTNESKDS